MPSLQQYYPLPEHIPTLTNDELRRLAPKKGCPTCGNTGTFLWDHDEEGTVVDTPVMWECNCLDQIILGYYFLRCGLNPKLSWRGLEELPDFDGVTDDLVDYVSTPDAYARAGISLKMTGDPFNGKSTWANYLLKVFIMKGWDVQSMSLDTLADTYSSTWNSKNKDAQLQQNNVEYFTERVMNVPVLLIDNIGRNNKRNDLSAVQQAFIRVTSERSEAGRPTLLTFSEKEGEDLVTTGHLDSTTMHLKLRGPNLSNANLARARADMHADIRRPLRLL